MSICRRIDLIYLPVEESSLYICMSKCRPIMSIGRSRPNKPTCRRVDRRSRNQDLNVRPHYVQLYHIGSSYILSFIKQTFFVVQYNKQGVGGDRGAEMEHNRGGIYLQKWSIIEGVDLQKWRRIEGIHTSRNGAKQSRGEEFFFRNVHSGKGRVRGGVAFTSRNGAENQDTCLYSLSRLLQLLAHELILDASSSSPAQIELGSETGTRVQTLSFKIFLKIHLKRKVFLQ